MKIRLCLTFLICAASIFAEQPKSILLIAGKASHGNDEHEFPAGINVLAKALNESGLNLNTIVHTERWPNLTSLVSVDSVVIYSDGNEDHIALGYEQDLIDLSNRGAGIVILHYALDGNDEVDAALLKSVGGFYETGKSENPIWTTKDPTITDHAITRGVKPFELKDEWYYNLTFSDVVPLLQAIPPEESETQTLAWAYGTNAFGFTGGHFHSSWLQPDYRKLILNAIVWSVGIEVPENGVESADPIIAKHKTILHAIAKGDPADVRNHLLLGADVNAKDKKGWTPLLFATVRGRANCVKVLIEQGAELDPRTGTEKTPMHFAADRGFLKIAKLLIENGSDILTTDDEGWSPLHYAAEKDRVDVAAYLIEHGAEVDMRSKRGGTPLHEASASASAEMITLLLDSGADKNIKATNGKTPLDYAIELGNKPAEEILTK